MPVRQPREAERALGVPVRRLTRNLTKQERRLFTERVWPLILLYRRNPTPQLEQQIRLETDRMGQTTMRLVDETLLLILANRMVNNVSQFVTKDTARWFRSFKLRVPAMRRSVSANRIMLQRVRETASLIRSIPAQHHANIAQAIFEHIEGKRTLVSLQKRVRDLGGITRRRANFIVRDQVGSARGELTKEQHKSLGIKRFRWMTQMDERVRPARPFAGPENHRRLNGKVFDWAAGAPRPYSTTGLPGGDVNCRCYAAPVREELERVSIRG